MKNLRSFIDSKYEVFCRIVYRNRIKTLLIILIISASLFSQLPKFTADFTDDAFFHPGDPTLETYNSFKDQFGKEEVIVIAIKPPEVFDSRFLIKLMELHAELEEEVPYLEDINSLVNARYTYGTKDELLVEDLLESVPQSSKEMIELKNRVLSSRLYPNLFISEDGTFTTILLKLYAYSPDQSHSDLMETTEMSADIDSNSVDKKPILLTADELSEAISAVRKITKRYEQIDFPVIITGNQVIGDFFEQNIVQEQSRFMGLSLLVFTLLLFVLFRRISGVLIPLSVVIFGLLSTVSLMAIFNAPFTHPTSVLPIFILSVSIGDSVHILAIFFRHFQNKTDKESAIVEALSHSGLPVLMTSLTTAAGMFSFAAADMLPVANLGIFGGVGVLLAWLYTVTLIPALVSLLPLKPKSKTTGKSYEIGLDKFLSSIADFSVNHATSILVISFMIVFLGAVGLAWQGFSHNVNEWLPHDSELRSSLKLIDEKLKGITSLEVVIDTGRENGLYEPTIMNAIDQLSIYSQSLRKENGVRIVGKTNSIVTLLKETHQALNENNARFYAVPANRKLIAQELLLFENSGSDDMEALVDSQFSKARLSIKVR